MKIFFKHHRTISWALLLIASALVLAAADVFIRDIIDTPSRWYNLEVRIQGEVVKVVAPPSLEKRGYYVVMDKSDQTIKIVAETLPAPQQRLAVTGIVQVDPQTQTPFLREVRREDLAAGTTGRGTAGVNPLIIVLIVLIVATIAALLVILLRKPKSAVSEQAAAGKPGSATKQVSLSDVMQQVGGIKTTQVPALLAQLTVSTGKQAGKSFPLKTSTTIGREIGDIVLDDSSISRQHAKIQFDKDKYLIENLSSTNPAILNGERIEGKRELKDGDEIIVGLIKLQFKLI